MLVAALLLTAAPFQGLPKAEAAMLKAIQQPNIKAIRKLIDRQIRIFTILPSPNKSSDLPEKYLVVSSAINLKSNDDDIKSCLERATQLVAKGTPTIVKSIHNDLTAHTLRGSISPGDDWEIHYDIRKDGSLIVKRICEFDHAPLFRW